MNITYEILSIIPDEHQIMVRFTSDAVPMSEMVASWQADGITPKTYRTDYLITLPVPVPHGTDFDAYVMQFCPVGWFKLKAQLANPNVNTEITVTVGTSKTMTV